MQLPAVQLSEVAFEDQDFLFPLGRGKEGIALT